MGYERALKLLSPLTEGEKPPGTPGTSQISAHCCPCLCHVQMQLREGHPTLGGFF